MGLRFSLRDSPFLSVSGPAGSDERDWMSGTQARRWFSFCHSPVHPGTCSMQVPGEDTKLPALISVKGIVRTLDCVVACALL